jgi:hypothetical protein
MTNRRARRLLLAAALLAALPLARADDDAGAQRQAMLARLAAPADAAVKPWPGVPDRTLVGWTVLRPGDDAGTDVVDLTLVLTQTSTGRPLARGVFPAAWGSDAVEFRSLSFDTAPWALAAGQRTFGLRAHFSHPGRLTSVEQENLWLFDVRGSTIVPVLSHLLVDETMESGQCGVYRERHATLAIAPTRSHGHADLKLDAQGMDAKDWRVEPPATCMDAVTRHWQGLLRYDGTRYVVPASIGRLH